MNETTYSSRSNMLVRRKQCVGWLAMVAAFDSCIYSWLFMLAAAAAAAFTDAVMASSVYCGILMPEPSASLAISASLPLGPRLTPDLSRSSLSKLAIAEPFSGGFSMNGATLMGRLANSKLFNCSIAFLASSACENWMKP